MTHAFVPPSKCVFASGQMTQSNASQRVCACVMIMRRKQSHLSRIDHDRNDAMTAITWCACARLGNLNTRSTPRASGSCAYVIMLDEKTNGEMCLNREPAIAAR